MLNTSSISIDASNCWLVPVLDQTNLLVPLSPVSKKGCWKVKRGGGVNERQKVVSAHRDLPGD